MLYNDTSRQRRNTKPTGHSLQDRMLKYFAKNVDKRFSVQQIFEYFHFNNDAQSTKNLLEKLYQDECLNKDFDEEKQCSVYWIDKHQMEDLKIDAGGDDEPVENTIEEKVETPIKATYPPRLLDEIVDDEKGFSVKVLNATPLPQTTIYMGLHQCYSSEPVDMPQKTEEQCGVIIVDKLLKGGKGHYSPLEHASISLGIRGFNKATIDQLLRHRIGVSPSVQSFRYTSKHITKAASNQGDVKAIEKVVYIRPVGHYQSREGLYYYDPTTRNEDLSLARTCVVNAARRMSQGMPAEQARGCLPFDYRQHVMITLNVRSLMAVLDKRTPENSQSEIRTLANMMMEIFLIYTPQIAEWYKRNRYGKSKLAP